MKDLTITSVIKVYEYDELNDTDRALLDDAIEATRRADENGEPLYDKLTEELDVLCHTYCYGVDRPAPPQCPVCPASGACRA